MWSIFSQDFSDFAEAFKSESARFMDYVEQIAFNVVGRGDIYAGDEILGKTVTEMPLSNSLLRRLQDTEATYALLIQPEEKAAFDAWVKGNPLSSANALHRQQNMAAGSPTSKPEGGSPAATPAQLSPLGKMPDRRSAEYPDEPISETRKRLLDYNEVVLQWYMLLVGDAVSPRFSVSGSPVAKRLQMDPPFASKFGKGEGKSPVSAVTSGEQPRVSSPSSALTPKHGRIDEDEFFDRYFFRLAQLRVLESQRRRAALARKTSGGTSAAVSQVPPTSPTTPSPSPLANERSPQSADEKDFAVVPLFAKRMMTATSNFVTGIDNALNSGVEGEVADEFSGDEANVSPTDLVHYRSARRQVADLESMVQELQEALRQERRRVEQLTSALEEQGIEVPARLMAPAPFSAAATPAKKAEFTLVAVPTPAPQIDLVLASPSGTAAAASSISGGAPATPLVAIPETPPLDNEKARGDTSSAQSTSGDMISAVTEDETWVCITPGAE
ncbi:hypothetical protein Q4I30_004600 [Leishmania utingensis]|uniref:BSD domain-containing protein n=1 Tax=Leishmania utingensis TaxID=653362 RepID=A0AAW3AE66_9TRYP